MVQNRAQSGIANSIKTQGQSVLGTPAADYAIQRRAMILTQKLPEIWNRLNNIERKIMDEDL